MPRNTRKPHPPAKSDRSHVYKAVLENLKDMVAVYDDQLNAIYVNPAMESVLGYDRREIVGRRTRDFTPEEDRPAIIAFGQRLLQNPGVRLETPIRFIRRDGAIRELESSAVNLLGAPEVRAVIVTSRDVTDARQAEREREATERKYLDLVNNITEGVYEVDLAGKFTFVNPAFVEILKRSKEEIIGVSFRRFTLDVSAKEVFQKFNEVFRTGHANAAFHYVVVNSAGEERTVEGSVSLIRDALGEPCGFRGAVRDVTERVRAEKALWEKTRQLERANQDLLRKNSELDEFTYISSHDLQEPVRKLVAFSQFLEKDMGGDLPERAARDVRFIIDAAHRMQRLIADLLALSRAGKSDATRQVTALDTCVDVALDALSMTIESTGAEIRRAESLPQVWADRTLMTQLFQNLIGNALKFRGEASPVIEITCESDPLEGLVLGVRDNGIGINPDYAEQVFAPFKRLHSREKYDGSGIGLAICRKCVARHGGRIWVEPVPGGGSHFKFTLPERRALRGAS